MGCLKAFTCLLSLYYSKVSDSNNPCLLQVKAILQCDAMKDWKKVEVASVKNIENWADSAYRKYVHIDSASKQYKLWYNAENLARDLDIAYYIKVLCDISNRVSHKQISGEIAGPENITKFVCQGKKNDVRRQKWQVTAQRPWWVTLLEV